MKNITVQQLAAIAEPQLIDVREPDEFAAGHAVGAINVPLGSLASAPVPDESATVYVICQSGGRSLRGVEMLTARGLDAVNVEGGTSAWIVAGLPAEAGR
ncbi:MAG TPA: rhodanese-like domain-containing protein [Pseudolysinimonas sp.]|nr:rhodanese-like domain-containing protein [Pseudolysinimonas sp.]